LQCKVYVRPQLERFGGFALENLLSVEEAARRLGGLSKWTIHAWLSKGRLQRTKVGGRTMIRESELTKVISDGGKFSVRVIRQQVP
jgi:excisionase family DNA binding protein